MNYKDVFINTIFSGATAPEIVVKFKNGAEITYTKRILNTLKSDHNVDYIYDKETGELLYDSTPW